SQNRNFHNRMGHGSLAHLATAATVAASAPSMKITDPRPLLAKVDQDRYRRILRERKPRVTPEVRIVEPQIALPASGSGVAANAQAASKPEAARRKPEALIRSRIQRFGDSVDTDAIIPGEFCHLTNLAEL